mgnify:CR=1 FL=1|tara:strand:+ start:453 stop:662 length:210 start_codon:yes stop_codon:yes gene_type:complete
MNKFVIKRKIGDDLKFYKQDDVMSFPEAKAVLLTWRDLVFDGDAFLANRNTELAGHLSGVDYLFKIEKV